METQGKSELSKAEFQFSEFVREQTVYIGGVHITRVSQLSPLPIYFFSFIQVISSSLRSGK